MAAAVATAVLVVSAVLRMASVESAELGIASVGAAELVMELLRVAELVALAVAPTVLVDTAGLVAAGMRATELVFSVPPVVLEARSTSSSLAMVPHSSSLVVGPKSFDIS